APVENQTPPARNMLPWIVGGLVVLALLAAFFLFRRRRSDAVYEESYYEPAPAREPSFDAPIDVAPVAAAEPIFVPQHDIVQPAAASPQPMADEPVAAIPPPEEINVGEADHADVEALAASSSPASGRPWLEFLMRPMRAGTNRDNAIVQ